MVGLRQSNCMRFHETMARVAVETREAGLFMHEMYCYKLERPQQAAVRGVASCHNILDCFRRFRLTLYGLL